MENQRAEDQRRQVLVAMRTPGPEATQALIGALADEDALVREWAIEALTRRKEKGEAIPALLQCLKDDRSDVRWYAARALGKLGINSPDISSALRGLLNDADEYVRCFAALALGTLRCTEAMPELSKKLLGHDQTQYEKVSVGMAIARINTVSAALPEAEQAVLFPEAEISAPVTGGLPLTKGEILKREIEGTAECIARDRVGGDLVVTGRIRLSYAYAHSLSLKERVLEERGRYCQLCGFTFRKRDGTQYAECHHVHPLSEGGKDEPDNLLVICANHHKELHFATVSFPGGRTRPGQITFNGVVTLAVNWPNVPGEQS